MKEPMLVAIYVSPGVLGDAGGFMIVGGKIIKIPPRGPAYQKIVAASYLLGQTEGLKDAGDIRGLAQKMLESGIKELTG